MVCVEKLLVKENINVVRGKLCVFDSVFTTVKAVSLSVKA